jgi:GntR family transcriptional repressor for pyruvate dehydrogenase complex
MPAPSAPRPPVSDEVFRALLDGLLAGRPRPGEKLPTQRALAADLGITVGSLREALKRLEQMGLIDVRHGDAMRARDWRRHGGLDVIAHLLAGRGLDRSLLADVFEARGLMLRELAVLAARRRSGAQAARLHELAAELSDAGDDEVARTADFDFFAQLAEAAGNLVFVLIMNSIRDLYFRHAERLPVTARPRELAPLYRSAAEAIGAGDELAARRAVERLAELQRRRVEEALA